MIRALLILLVAAQLHAADYSTTVLGTTGLVAYWRLGEASGNFTDAVGGHTATASASGITYGQTGAIPGNTAVTFTGTPGVATVSGDQSAFNFANATPWSVEFMVNPNVLRSGGAMEYSIISKMLGSGAYTGWAVELRWDGTRTGVEMHMISTLSAWLQIMSGTATDVPNGLWTHVVVTYDGTHLPTGVKIYVNGNSVTTAIGNNNLGTGATTNAVNTMIGNRNGIQWFKGGVDELAVYNVVLDAATVTAHYQAWHADPAQVELSFSTSAPVPMVIDDDDGTDVDNFENLYFALHLQRLGYIKLLGFIDTQSSTNGPACVEQFLRYAGRAGIPVGAYQTGDLQVADSGTMCATILAALNPDYGDRSTYTSAAAQYRALLSSAADASVVLVLGGPGSSLYQFLNDAGPPTGMSLFTQKVKKVIWVAGIYPTGSEWNFTYNATSRANANWVLANWPASIPLEFMGIEQGNTVKIGSTIAASLQSKNPMAMAYQRWGGGVREAWTLLAIVRAALDSGGVYFRYGGSNGTNTVNASTGANTWAATPNTNHSYLVKNYTDAYFQWLFDTYIVRDVHPWTATWSAAF